jgi:hypothetical protein
MVHKQCKVVGLFIEVGKLSTEKWLLILTNFFGEVAKYSSCHETLPFVTKEAFCLEYRVVLWEVLSTASNSLFKM